MTTKHQVFAAKPRLSDEEPDLLEQDDVESTYSSAQDGWLPWDTDDLIDIHRIVQERMPKHQRDILEAFLCGMTFAEINVTEKYFRYHYQQAVEFIKIELKL
jgi:hypothetical protein